MNLAHNTFLQLLVSVFAGWGIASWNLNAENAARERDVVRTYDIDLSVNEKRLDWNDSAVAQETKLLHGGHILAGPLTALSTDGWTIFRGAVPSNVLADEKLLRDVIETQELVNLVNATIQSRETYRQGNRAISNFTDNLKGVNTEIVDLQKAVKPRIQRIRTRLETFK